MSHILLYQLNHNIESRSFTESDSFEGVINKLIDAYKKTINVNVDTLPDNQSKVNTNIKNKPFIDLDNLLIFLYSMFDLMLLIKDKDEQRYLTYGKDCTAEMILDFINKI